MSRPKELCRLTVLGSTSRTILGFLTSSYDSSLAAKTWVFAPWVKDRPTACGRKAIFRIPWALHWTRSADALDQAVSVLLRSHCTGKWNPRAAKKDGPTMSILCQTYINDAAVNIDAHPDSQNLEKYYNGGSVEENLFQAHPWSTSKGHDFCMNKPMVWFFPRFCVRKNHWSKSLGLSEAQCFGPQAGPEAEKNLRAFPTELCHLGGGAKWQSF